MRCMQYKYLLKEETSISRLQRKDKEVILTGNENLGKRKGWLSLTMTGEKNNGDY